MNLIKQRQRGIWYKKTIIAGVLIVKLIFSNAFMCLYILLILVNLISNLITPQYLFDEVIKKLHFI